MSEEGEIRAVLKLDGSDYTAGIEKAKAEAESLATVDPQIRVKADTAGAIAQLEAVKVAADQAGAAGDKAGRDLTNAAKGPIPWMGILVGSIAAVSPGIVAVGAAAIGLSGSLVGMGLAGVLAFKGIEAEMAAGTALGSQYTAMFAGLTNDLTTLERTAAVGIFAGLSSAVHTVEGDMRPLTADVALLSGQLGGLLATSADTAVHAINGFTPVLVAGGAALQGFLRGIDGFTQSNGFTAFIDYTVARLPDVMHLIDSTLGAVGGIFSALAPAGQSTLFMLSSLMDLIRALAPTLGALMPAVIGLSDAIGGIALVVSAVLNTIGPFGPMIVGTTGAVVGLGFASRALAPALIAAADAEGIAAVATRALGTAIDFAMGPLGLALIAVGLFVGAVTSMSAASKETALGLSAYSDAIRSSNTDMQSAVAHVAQLQVAHAGLGATLREAGVTQEQLTHAISVGGSAYTELRNQLTGADQALKNNNQASLQNITAKQQIVRFLDQERAGVIQAIANYNKYAKSVGDSTVKTYAELTARKQLAASLGMTVDQFTAAEGATQKAAAAAQTLHDKYVLAGDAANLLKLDMDKLNGATISNAEAQAAWASGLDSLKSSFNANSKAITGNSNAALENRGAVASLAATGETALQSIAGMSHSASQTTAAYKSMRSQLIDTVTAMGVSKSAAAALVDQYFKIPKSIKTDFKGDDRDAKAKAAAAKAAALDFARGDYKAAYKADPTPANKAAADAMAKADAYARKRYEATLKANPNLANGSVADVSRKVHALVSGFYEAKIRANNWAALSVIDQTRARLRAIDGTTATVYVSAVAAGVSYAQSAAINRNAQMFHADGGSIGMAGGGTPGYFSGTVSGPGTSWNDQAGRYNLADREFVMSNKYGQADWSRPLLEAINSQRVKTPAQLGQMLGGQHGPTTVINRTIQPVINIHNPVVQDLETLQQEANQYQLAYAGLI